LGDAEKVESVAIGRAPRQETFAKRARFIVAAFVEAPERLADVVPRRSASAAPPLFLRASHG
jgi:hypothetical protein